MSDTLGQQATVIQNLARRLETDPYNGSLRRALVDNVEELHRAVRPDDYFLNQQAVDIARSKSLSALLQLNVIDNMPPFGEDISASELAERSRVDERVIVRLMRILTATGMIKQSGASNYSLTRFSKQLRRGLDARGRWLWNTEEVCRPNLGEYLKAKSVEEMNDAYQCPLNWEDGHEGIPWLAAKIYEDMDLETVAKFRHAKRWDSEHFPVLNMFPFEILAFSAQPSQRAFFVDVGGGEGGPLMQIREHYQDLTSKGEWILQDHVENLVDIEPELMVGIAVREHSYFDPQPVQGAVAYYLRRVLQNWSDEKAVDILLQLAMAMASDSRLLICELLLPSKAEPGMDLTPYIQDYFQWQIGGKVRTEEDFQTILRAAGLELVHVWKHTEGGSWVVLETKVAESSRR